MNDKFIIMKRMKIFIINLNNILINYPRKELILKNRIINTSYDILELINICNLDNKKDNFNILLSKIFMLDFYLEISYYYKYISESVCNKKALELESIRKMIYGWIKSIKYS